MKTNLFALFLICSFSSLFAQNNVGIGTTTPSAKLHIIENNDNISLRSRNIYSGTGQTFGIMGENLGSGSGDRIGIFGNTLGDANATSIFGVYGKGNANNADLTSYGGYFITDNEGVGLSYGVFGKSTGAGNYGVYGENTTADGWAGYFNGRVHVSNKLGVGMDPADERVAISSGNKTGLYLENISSSSDTVTGIKLFVDDNSTALRFGINATVEPETSSTENAYGIYSVVKNGGTGAHYGVHGTANGDNNVGVYGKSNNAGIGVQGENSSDGGTGVQGLASGTGTGVQGIASGTGIAVKGTHSGSGGWAGYFEGITYTEKRAEISDKIFLRPLGNGGGGEIELRDNDGDQTVLIRAGQTASNGAELLMYSDTNVKTVELDADVDGSGEIFLSDNDGDLTVVISAAQNATNGAEILLYNDAQTKTIELDADFNGVGRVITDELEIKAGSDLAEFFNITEKKIAIEAGMVVSIDKEQPGQLQINTKANNQMAVGVISGANGIRPGMMMGQRGTIAYGDHPVAMTGRVYVKADATKMAIKPGDLLTSSNLNGHAMKVKNKKKSMHAILGRALTGLEKGTGFVLMIID